MQSKLWSKTKPGYVRSLRYDPVNIWSRICRGNSALAFSSDQTSARFRVNIKIYFLSHSEKIQLFKSMSLMNLLKLLASGEEEKNLKVEKITVIRVPFEQFKEAVLIHLFNYIYNNFPLFFFAILRKNITELK